MKSTLHYLSLITIVTACLVLTQAFTKPENTRSLSLEIKPMFGKEKLLLEKQQYITEHSDTVNITRFRFYISHIQLQLENGSVYTEKNSYHLIDMEDTTTLKINLSKIPQGIIQKMSFKIGVDSLASVSGALDGDLDPIKGMYWAWNSGYINAKLEGTSPSSTARHKEFEFHVGGYLAPYYALRSVALPVKSCNNSSLCLIADAAQWFKNIRLSKNNSIVTPGAEAMEMADRYVNMFSIPE